MPMFHVWIGAIKKTAPSSFLPFPGDVRTTVIYVLPRHCSTVNK